MSKVKEIIILDDDEEEEEPPRPTKATARPCNSSKETNGKTEESGSSPPSKAEVISAQNKTLFNEFIEFCSNLTSDHPEVISFLQGRYSKANPSYLTSVEFRNTLGRCLSRVQAKRSKVFVYINELCTSLKANSQKRKVILQPQASQQPDGVQAETPAEIEEEEAESVPEKKTGSKRQIRYLENLLRIYSLEIKKLQEKELSLDELEDEDSSYIQESRLKRKLLRIFEKLCELKDCSNLTGRVIEQRILYRGTRYPEVNRRLEKFINSTRDLFPDYGDVIQVVERANEKHSLGLSRKQMQSMAQDAFRELGNKLQDRRHLDMIYNFGSHLTDPYKSVNDPAQQDLSLSRRLRENRNMALNSLDNVIKKYAQLQDDSEEDTRRKTRRTSGKNPQTSSEGSEEDVESENSETDIEEELEHSKERPDSEEGENEEEEVLADQENEADQKMEMASDGEKEKEDGEEATEQDSSPASSTSLDKDSSNTTLESEVEAQLSGSSGLPSNGSPAKAKSDDEHDEEQEVCDTPTSPKEQTEENQEDTILMQSPENKEFEETEGLLLNCESSPDNTVKDENHKNTGRDLLNDMTVSLMVKDKDDLKGDGKDVTEPADHPSPEGSDAEMYSEPSPSPVGQDESCPDVNTEEPSVSRRTSIDSETASMKEETGCKETSGNHDDEDDDCVVNATATRDQTPSDSPIREDEVTRTKVHTAATDLADDCENKTDCDLSPLPSRNGVHMATPVRKTSLHRLKLRKINTSLIKDSCKPSDQEEDRSLPRRKRKVMSPENWTKSNGLNIFNGKERREDHKEKSSKRIKLDHSYTSLSSSDCDSITEDEDTPGLMMTCSSPVDTPTKPIRKSHVSTQCDPDEVIVLSD